MKTRDALKRVHPKTIIAGLGEICKGISRTKPSFRNLLLSVIAVCVSPTFRLNEVASRLPICVESVKSKQKRFYRFLEMVFPIEAVTCAWGRFVLQRLWCQKQSGCNPLVLVDETDLPGRWKAIVGSVAFRHRAIPIFWRVYSDAELREGVYKSHNALITAFCEATWTLACEPVAHRQFAPVFVFDCGFARAQYVLAPLIAKGIPFVMRVPCNVSVQTENGWCRVDTLPTGYQGEGLYTNIPKYGILHPHIQTSEVKRIMFPMIEARIPIDTPPLWAVLERRLIEKMNAAAPGVLQKYTRSDGTLLWPTHPDFQSIDGLDDAYESFHNWPLFYLLGGDARFLADAHTEFEGITSDMARYGTGHGYPMVVKEYQPGYDWFHQGEGNYLFYMLCMADPSHSKNIERAKRFAGFFMDEDPAAQNYDKQHKILKCAMNGSKGPAFWAFTGHPYWPWDGYNMPFYDIPGGTSHEAVRENEALRTRMGQLIRERQGIGDTVVNLAATSLATNAYLLTGEEKYRAWVREYVDAWIARTAENGGTVPDNVGLSGKIGEHIDGKWYGAYYGWSWPHGWHSVGQAVGIAAQNATLLSQNLSYLDFPRSQIDILIERGIEKDDQLYVPQKYGDPGKVNYVPGPWLRYPITNDDGTALQVDGWFEFMPMHPSDIAHVWAMSMLPTDQDRAKSIAKRTGSAFDINAWHHIKDSGGHDGAWLAYMRGEYPEYPEAILNHNLSQVEARLAFMANDDEDPSTYGDAYFQRRNPITCEGLVQLMCGGPLPHYNGGLLVTRVRHFDGQQQRPGLPLDVGALVSKMTADTTELQLVNLNRTEPREVIVQAGAMGEHHFTSVSFTDDRGRHTLPVNGTFLHITLPPYTQIEVVFGMRTFANVPSYKFPW